MNGQEVFYAELVELVHLGELVEVAEELAEQVRDFFVSGEVRGIVNPEVLEGPATESKS